MEDVLWWRELLAFMRIKAVFVYHGLDVCEGACDLESVARYLDVPVIHTGVLLPRICRTDTRRQPQALAISMGGGVRGREIADFASAIACANPEWDVDLYLGPYADLSPGVSPTRLHTKQFAPNFASTLTGYAAAISTGGYGACMDHIAAMVPAMFLPLHIEQEANVRWARQYLPGQLVVDTNNRIKVIPHNPRPAPRSFSWSVVENLL
jgi:predicted glycosyltransferase